MIDEQGKITEIDAMNMIADTSKLLAKDAGKHLSSLGGNLISNKLVDNVEFWKWMNRNFQPSNIYSSAKNIQEYISRSEGVESAVSKQLQGKGYEWDWMQRQRGQIKNFFKNYFAGDKVNRPGTDVSEYNMLNGQTREVQLKAYLSKTNPDLHNTPKDVTVVTNKEKVAYVKKQGYKNVEEFQSKSEIEKARDNRLNDAKQGKAAPQYTVKNVGLVMAKAGIIGAVFSAGAEAFASWESWKSGAITSEEYLKEIEKASGNGGVTAAATAGMMIKVNAALTVAGASSIIAFPIAIVLGTGIDKIVAPCFGRGRYKQLLNEAKYYQSLESMHKDLLISMQVAGEQYGEFLFTMQQQTAEYQELNKINATLDAGLNDLLKKI